MAENEHDDVPDGFITLPPGIFDSGTIKRPSRTERPPEEPSEIVFVPTVPGMPPSLPPAEVVAESDDDVRPAPDPEFAPPPAAPAPTWILTLPDATHVVVVGTLLVGRDPAPRAEWPGAALLAVNDPARSVSKTHALFDVENEALWVRDLESTNGVWIIDGDADADADADESVTEVAPGRPLLVPDGARVELGDFVVAASRG